MLFLLLSTQRYMCYVGVQNYFCIFKFTTLYIYTGGVVIFFTHQHHMDEIVTDREILYEER